MIVNWLFFTVSHFVRFIWFLSSFPQIEFRWGGLGNPQDWKYSVFLKKTFSNSFSTVSDNLFWILYLWLKQRHINKRSLQKLNLFHCGNVMYICLAHARNCTDCKKTLNISSLFLIIFQSVTIIHIRKSAYMPTYLFSNYIFQNFNNKQDLPIIIR